MYESHGSQLSGLTDAHNHHTGLMESHKLKLSELQAAHSNHASVVQSQESKLSSLESAHGRHAAMVETFGTQLSELATAHKQQLGATETHRDQFGRLEAAQGHAAALAESHANQLSSLQDRHAVAVESHKQHIGELQARQGHHASTLESLQHQMNSLRNLDQLVGGLSADIDVIRRRQQDSNHRPHESHDLAFRFEEQTALIKDLRSKINELEVRSAESAELHKTWKASQQELHQAHTTRASAMEDSHAQHRDDLAKLQAERMEEVGIVEVERTNQRREAAAMKIQCSARGRFARKQVAERKEAMAADIQLVPSELQVSGVESVVIERQETALSSATSERQVTGSDKQSVAGTPQAQRSWWRRLTSGGSSQASPHATPLQLTILGAKGLRVADWTHGEGKSDPYCVCELKGKSKASKTQTQTVYHDLDPEWNHKATFNEYVVGDSLVFKIFDVDYIHLGDLVLPCEKFHPHGFEGELPLENAGEDSKAVLRLKIEASLESTSEL